LPETAAVVFAAVLIFHFLFSPKISSFDSLRISSFLCYNLPVKTIAAAPTFILLHSPFACPGGFFVPDSFQIRIPATSTPGRTFPIPSPPHLPPKVFDPFVLFLFEFE